MEDKQDIVVPFLEWSQDDAKELFKGDHSPARWQYVTQPDIAFCLGMEK